MSACASCYPLSSSFLAGSAELLQTLAVDRPTVVLYCQSLGYWLGSVESHFLPSSRLLGPMIVIASVGGTE